MRQAEGSERAMITEAYQEHLTALRSYLYRLVCDREAAHDLAQDAFVKALEKSDSFKGSSSYRTWLFAIATNLAVDRLRHRKRWDENAQDRAKALAESDKAYSERFRWVADNSPHGKYELKEHIDLCFTCTTKTLPIGQQVSLLLKEIYDFKVDEIARILDRPEGTVKHWLFHSRRTMTGVFDRRCALVNQNGVCHQCTELNGFFNPKQAAQEKAVLALAASAPEELLDLRIKLVKAIDPLGSNGADVQDSIMQVLRSAIGDI